ncbi:YciI family protein [Brevibacillus sp. B_LB10_24]|uniref:YciI family protein n=1 Tax=Brevibacillus sp. B_LB10_24 TaxID=3380645 RepID=UPI0038B99C0E
MRYMLMVKSTGYSEAGVKHGREYNDAMIAFRQSLARAGVLLAAEDLQPSSSGIRITYPLQGGKPEVNVGPFPVDQQLIAGYTLIDVTTEEEAVEWALRMPVPISHGEYEIEMRKLQENLDAMRDPRALAMEGDLEDQINMLKKYK